MKLQRIGSWLLFLATLLLILVLGVPDARAGEVILPHANGSIGGDYRTALHIANPQDEEAFFSPSSFGADRRRIPPRSTLVIDQWPAAASLGFARIDVPDGLHAYVRVTINESMMVQNEPLAPITSDRPALFLDLPSNDRYKSFLMFGSLDGTGASLATYGSDYAAIADLGYLAPGETKVVEVSAQGEVAIGLSASSRFFPQRGTLYAFGMIAKQPSGELLDVPARFAQ
jgi:hypothetical protein